MSLQSQIFIFTGSGVPGEIYLDTPRIAQSYVLNSASAAFNIIGATFFTVNAQGLAQAGLGTGSPANYGFAGILFNPKVYSSFGTQANGPLYPTLTLANGVQAEIISQGTLWVTLSNSTANIGDLVFFNNTTGVLSSIAPTATPAGGTTYANAQVTFYDITSGLAVINLNQSNPTPA